MQGKDKTKSSQAKSHRQANLWKQGFLLQLQPFEQFRTELLVYDLGFFVRQGQTLTAVQLEALESTKAKEIEKIQSDKEDEYNKFLESKHQLEMKIKEWKEREEKLKSSSTNQF